MAKRQGLTFYQKKKKINFDIVKEVISWIFWICVSAFLALVLMYCIGMKTTVIGSSMEPCLYNGQSILLNRLVYKVSSPKKGDVIAFYPNGNDKSHIYCKRVAGTPGDTIQIVKGNLIVNGEEQNQYFHDKIAEAGLCSEEMVLGTDEYFVIGDNCNNSEDSRSANIGNIKKAYITGKVWFKLAAGDSAMGLVKK